jgi:hypothetical protein
MDTGGRARRVRGGVGDATEGKVASTSPPSAGRRRDSAPVGVGRLDRERGEGMGGLDTPTMEWKGAGRRADSEELPTTSHPTNGEADVERVAGDGGDESGSWDGGQ